MRVFSLLPEEQQQAQAQAQAQEQQQDEMVAVMVEEEKEEEAAAAQVSAPATGSRRLCRRHPSVRGSGAVPRCPALPDGQSSAVFHASQVARFSCMPWCRVKWQW